jgi:hypothetical protein
LERSAEEAIGGPSGPPICFGDVVIAGLDPAIHPFS